MFDLFLQGGTWIMSILTVELICLLFAAQQVGDVPLTLVAGGLKVSFISLIYALLIYAASLVIRMLQKPRI